MSVCPHYTCEVDIQAFCCKEFFSCRLCHDIIKNEEEKDPKKRHTINRYEISVVRCRRCSTEQPPSQSCSSCNLPFATYYCDVCHLYESNPNKIIYHCAGCNICRIGPAENFFHCFRCQACLAISVKDSHKCIEGVTKGDCAICQENLFYSRDQSIQLKCGHHMHNKCYKSMLKNHVYTCPMCLKYVVDVNDDYIESLDKEIADTPMPEELRELMVNILCNECNERSEVKFHIFGLKCAHCGKYNTSRI